MLVKFIVIWVVGLVTIVPYGTWYLFFEAQRDQYALLITLVLFWIFGYWGIAGPIIMLIKVRKVFKVIERATTQEELMAAIHSDDARDVAVDLIATENHVPRFVAERVYNLLLARLASLGNEAPTARDRSGGAAGPGRV